MPWEDNAWIPEPPVSVRCHNCGWRGRRVRYDPRLGGHCSVSEKPCPVCQRKRVTPFVFRPSP